MNKLDYSMIINDIYHKVDQENEEYTICPTRQVFMGGYETS